MPEVETLKLLGATRSFIKLPFLIEGLFIGGLSGAVSSLMLLAFYYFTANNLADFLPSIRAFTISLPLYTYLAAPVAGASMSLIGSFFATGKIRY
jgi:cell division protein FtsX